MGEEGKRTKSAMRLIRSIFLVLLLSRVTVSGAFFGTAEALRTPIFNSKLQNSFPGVGWGGGGAVPGWREKGRMGGLLNNNALTPLKQKGWVG